MFIVTQPESKSVSFFWLEEATWCQNYFGPQGKCDPFNSWNFESCETNASVHPHELNCACNYGMIYDFKRLECVRCPSPCTKACYYSDTEEDLSITCSHC